MKISIKNLGIIDNANLEINNISVLVGKNGTGKSTIGKGIYTVIKSMSDSMKKTYIDSKDCY